MWQEILVGICVVAALLFVLKRYIPIGKKDSVACNGCSGCSDKKGCSTSH